MIKRIGIEPALNARIILMTAFVTDTHDTARHTVFVPTGPNPTSSLIFHVPQKYVHPAGVSVEETMRSVIGCGAGSTNLINGFERRMTLQQDIQL